MANVFEEGEPLNVVALGEMYTELQKLRGQFGSFTAAGDIVNSLLGPTIPIIAYGSDIVSVTAGTPFSIDITDQLSKKFLSGESPIVVASHGSNYSSGEVTTVSSHAAGGRVKIYILSNKSKDIRYNWIATYSRKV